jgi:F-type H+-transporting ATPase subunit delta
MADVNLAAKRYAQAAFALAVQHNDTDVWRDAMDQIGEFMGDPEVRRVLENTRVARAAKQQLIDAALGSLPVLALNLSRLLVRKGRTALAPDIATEFHRLLEIRQGIAHARAVTAVPLDDDQRRSLTQRLEQQTGQRILLETEVDPGLLGGVLVQIGDKLVDASTRAKLEALRQSLVGSVG